MNALFWWTGALLWLCIALTGLLMLLRYAQHCVEAAILTHQIRRHIKTGMRGVLGYWLHLCGQRFDRMTINGVTYEWPSLLTKQSREGAL